MKPSATSGRQPSCRGARRVLTEIQTRPRWSDVTKFAGGSVTPSTSVTNGASRPFRSSRHTPPAPPRLASRNDPSGRSAIPLGRTSSVVRASHVSCEPSAVTRPCSSSLDEARRAESGRRRMRVTPPRQSGTKRSPFGCARTHSGRCRSLPTGSSCEMDTGPCRKEWFTSTHASTRSHLTDTVRVVRGVCVLRGAYRVIRVIHVLRVVRGCGS